MKYLLSFALTLLLAFSVNTIASAQVFWEDNFEGTGPNLGGGVRAAPNHANPTDGSNTDVCGANDYFFRTDCNTASGTPGQNCAGITDVFTGGSGFMWRGEDLDGCIADPDIINFTGIDITGKANLVFKGLFAADDDPNDWEGVDAADGHPDQLLVAYQIDGGGYTTGIVFRSDGSDHPNTGDNRGLLRVDTDDDGFGDGPVSLGLAFQEFSFSIPGSGTTLDLRFEAFVNGGGEEFAIDLFQVEEGENPPVCPSLGMVDLSESSLCTNATFDVSITGMANMASATNNDQDYGVSFVAFEGTPTDPYTGGTSLGTVPFDDFTDSGTSASLIDANLAVAGNYLVYAILSPPPADTDCRPSAVSANIEVMEFVSLTFQPPGDFCLDTDPQTALSGATPTGGVYSGTNVTDNGDGETFSFDPSAAGVGVFTVTYTDICGSTASQTIEVFALPTVAFTGPGTVELNAGIQTELGGGTPAGGVYAGPGVTDDGNGMTYTFDPGAIGEGTYELSYTYTDGNGCSGSASAMVTVTALIDCPEGDVILLSQADVDAYVAAYPDCPVITGKLVIGNGVGSTDISDISGLSNLTTIGGNLSIFYNDNLSSLEGLEGITSVGGDLYVFRNNILTDLTGLNALSSVGGALYIFFNANLNNLIGLDVLNSVGGYLAIRSNPTLASLDGLESLTAINGFLAIRFNPSLTDIQGIVNIDPASISRLYISGNTSLSDCAIDNVCAYLAVEVNLASITKNADKCNNRAQVESDCSTMGMEAVIQSEVNAVNPMILASSEKLETHKIDPAIKLFPNPTNGLLQIRNIEAQRVLVFNPQGQRMAQYEAPGSELDLSNLSTGVYYLSFFTPEDRYTVRVVKVD